MVRQILRLFGDQRASLRTYAVALLLDGILMGATVTLLVPVLRHLLDGDVAGAWTWLAALAAAAAVTGAVHYRQAMLGFDIALDLMRRLHHRLGDHVSALPLGWFDSDRTGRLSKSVTQGLALIVSLPAHLFAPLVTAVAAPLTVALCMLAFDWRLAVAMLAAVPVLALVYRWCGELTARADRKVDAAGVDAGGRVVEFARAQAVLRSAGQVGRGYAQLDAALQRQRIAGRSQLLSTLPGMALFGFAVHAAFAVLVVLGTSLALGGSIDAAELLALLVLVTRFTGPLVEAADLGGVVRMARNDLDRIDEILDVTPLPEPAVSHEPADSGVAVEQVSFGYADNTVIDDVSFEVPARTMTALVGPSGSGKTTLTRLIARFWDVDAGAVRIGGVDVRDMSTEHLMRQVSMVFQDVYLFDDTIEANVRVGRPDASTELVRDAAGLAGVDEIVERLPDGWDTRVGEGGTSLSGGERQRVSIARAILKDAPVVLLDEATAALDPENETVVSSALRVLVADRTLLVIAHRLQTVVAADQIVVLEGGRVAEVGTHEGLLAAGGRYADFWAERSRAQGWRIDAVGAGGG